MDELEAGEKVEADLQYQGEKLHSNEENIFLSEYLVFSCHETVNKRLKQLSCEH